MISASASSDSSFNRSVILEELAWRSNILETFGSVHPKMTEQRPLLSDVKVNSGGLGQAVSDDASMRPLNKKNTNSTWTRKGGYDPGFRRQGPIDS
jgi:hypothetical protein